MNHLRRWPLLLTGLLVITAAIGLFGDRDDPSDARALLLGLGCVLVGAGIAIVVMRPQGDTNTDTPEDPS